MKEKFLLFDSNKNPTEKYYDKLPKEEREIVDRFGKDCLIQASEVRAKKYRSNAIRFLIMAKKPLKNINLNDLRDFLRVLKGSGVSQYYMNDVRGFVQKFLKWNFKDWSERFDGFNDIRFNSEPQREKKINPEDVLKKEDIEKLIKAENNLYWKCFIIVQYQSALRTLEARQLKWENVDLKEDEIGWLNISSRKNKNGNKKERTAPPLDNQGVFLLRELKKQQKETNNQSPYVFPSKEDTNNFISSGSVSKWFSRLTQKVLKKKITNYILRHSRGESLHELVRIGKLSKENALLMMGHSEKMFDKTYSHPNKQTLKQVLKKQVLDIDYIAPGQKNKLEKEIEILKQGMREMVQVTDENTKSTIQLVKDMRAIMDGKPVNHKGKIYRVVED